MNVNKNKLLPYTDVCVKVVLGVPLTKHSHLSIPNDISSVGDPLAQHKHDIINLHEEQRKGPRISVEKRKHFRFCAIASLYFRLVNL